MANGNQQQCLLLHGILQTAWNRDVEEEQKPAQAEASPDSEGRLRLGPALAQTGKHAESRRHPPLE
jgi:hypothetical protein